MDQLEVAIANLSKLNPGLLDLYDFAASVKKRADLFGVPAELLKDDRQVAAARKAAAQQAQAQQTLQQAPQLATAAKNLNQAGDVGQEALAQIANG